MFKKMFLFGVAILFSITLVACGGSTDVDTISVDPSSVTIEEGESITVSVTVSPENAEYDLEWSSADEAVATVSAGEITGVAAGTTTVYVTAGNEEATVSVTVTEVDDDDDDDDEEDTIAPILTIDPQTVEIEYGQSYDLMNGVSALDNVDGNITSEITITDDGGFDNSTPGEYTVHYHVEDSSGNEATGSRTITVNELRLTITIDTEDEDDERTYPLELNPDMYYRDNVNSLAYPREFVTAFDADYYNWMVENQPYRIFAGWSVVVVLDADFNVHITRDYVSNQTNPDGTTGTAADNDWCSGSPSGGNEEWCTYLGMVANIDVPDGGYVLIFPNGAGPVEDPNGEDSPRFFGAHYFASSAFGPQERLNMKVTLNNLPDGMGFDVADARPTLDLSRTHNVNLDVGDTFPDLMDGVSADEGLTVEVTRVWYYDDNNEEVVIDVEDLATTEERMYFVRYYVEDSEGRYDRATRTYTISEPVDEEAENIGTINLGYESFTAIYNFTAFADEYNVHEDQAYVLTKDFLLDQIAEYEAEGDEFQIRYSVLAVSDAYGNILHYRHLLPREISEAHPFPGADGGWSNDAQLDQALLDAIPEDGYLVVFPNSPDNTEGGARHTGVSWLYHDQGNHSEEPNINPLEQRLQFAFDEYVMAEKEGTVVIEGQEYSAIHNLGRFFDYSNERVGRDVVYVLDKEHLAYHLDLYAAENDGATIAVTYSFVVVLDANGYPLVIRNVLGGEVRHDDQIVNDSPAWTNVNQLHDILTEVPEGGQVVIFANGTDGREFGGEMLWNEGPVYDDNDNETQTWRGDFTVDAFNRLVEFVSAPVYTQEAGYIAVSGTTYEATRNLSVFFTEDNIGTNYPTIHMLDRDYLEYGLDLYAAANDGATKIVQYGFIVILDELGNPVALRNVLGQEVTVSDPTMNTEHGWSSTNQLNGILEEVPVGGSILVFHGGGDIRDIGSHLFWSDQPHDGANPDQTWRNDYGLDAFSLNVDFTLEAIQE